MAVALFNQLDTATEEVNCYAILSKAIRQVVVSELSLANHRDLPSSAVEELPDGAFHEGTAQLFKSPPI